MRLSPEGLCAWLVGPDVVDASGAVWSWHNPAHPGYVYPEAAGLVLGALAAEPGTHALRARVADWLCAHAEGDGFGRDGARYAFDTCVCLAGLLAHERAGGVLRDPGLPARLGRAARAMLDRGVPVEGAVAAPAGHWSVSYGCHLLKCAVALLALDAREGDARGRATVRGLLDALLPLARGGRFPVHGASTQSYLHAALYALEGLMCLHAWGYDGLGPTLDEGAAWLASAQDASGGLRAWHDGARAWGPLRGDATAQAMRLWAWHDGARWSGEIARASGFLAGAQSARGGVRYEPEGADENTWVTAFALQARRWVDAGGGDARWIL